MATTRTPTAEESVGRPAVEAQASPPAADLVRALGWLERGTRTLVLLALVAFGSWTLVYQAALLLGLPAKPTLAAAAVLTAAISVAVLREFVVRLRAEKTARLPAWQYLAAALVALGCIGTALAGHRGIAVGILVAAAGAWVGYAAVTRARVPLVPREADQGEPGLWLVGWFWALVCGALSSVLARPDGDDAYFVNLSEWVADRGTFPLRDTMLSDEVFPALSSHSPPVHSIEGLIGAVGNLTGMPAGTLTYVVAPPLLTGLAVLALTWLVSESRVRYAPAALSAAVLFLVTSGASGGGYGNFFALRIWQGKAVLVSVVLPLLIAAAIAFIRHGGWRRGLVVGLAVVGTVGASNTAVFLVPVLLAGLLVAAWLVGGVRRALGIALALAYPIVCGLVVVALARPSSSSGTAEEAPSTVPLDPLVTVPGHGWVLVVLLLAVTLGWLGLRSSVARAVVVSVTLAAGVALIPVVSGFLADAVGVGSVIWRMWWVIPGPLLVAGLVGAVADVVRGRWSAVAAVTAAAAVGLLPLVDGKWIGSHRNGARFVSPISWKTPVGAEAEARLALRVSRDGDVILAPWDASRVLAGMSVDVHPVSARTIYLRAYLPVPGAHGEERQALQRFADSTTVPAETLRPLLDTLSVDTACVAESRGRAVDALEESGFRVAAEGGGLVCLRR